MLYTITHLKAPWPAGATVGDVIDLPAVPDWAAGKCVPADPGATATVGFASKVAEPEAPAEAPADAAPVEPKARRGRG